MLFAADRSDRTVTAYKMYHREGLHDISAVPFYFWRRFMTHTQELDKALNELKRITGVSLNVSADTPEEEEQALTQVRCLCTAYREKYNKNDFLQSLMMNGIPSYDIYERASRLHIAPEEKRTLFLLETRIIDDTVMAILKNLLSVSDENLSCLCQRKFTRHPSPCKIRGDSCIHASGRTHDR